MDLEAPISYALAVRFSACLICFLFPGKQFLFLSSSMTGLSHKSEASKSSAPATKKPADQKIFPSSFCEERMASQMAMMKALPGEPGRYVIQGPPINVQNQSAHRAPTMPFRSQPHMLERI